MTEEVVRPDSINKQPPDFSAGNSHILKLLQDTYTQLPGSPPSSPLLPPFDPNGFTAENPGCVEKPVPGSGKMTDCFPKEVRERIMKQSADAPQTDRDSMKLAIESLSVQLKSYEQAMGKAQADQGFLGNFIDSVKNNLGSSGKDGAWWSYVINSDNGSAQVTKDLQVLREQITQANTYAVSGDVEQFSKKYEQLTGHKYSAKDVAVLSTDGMSDSIENYAQSQKSGVDVLSTIGSVAAVVAVTRGNASAGATLLKGALAGGTAKSALTLGQADTNFLHEFGRGAVIGGSMIAGELAAGKVSSHVALNKSLVLEGEGRFARIATAGLDYSKQGLKTRLTSAAAYHGTMGSVVCATATVGDELVNSVNEGRLPEVSRTIAAAAAGGVLGFGLGTGLGFVSGAVIDGLVTKQSPKLLAEVRQPKLLTEGTPPLTEVPPPAVVVEVAEKIEPAKLATNELDDLLQKYNVAADRIGTNQNNAQALRGLADAMKAGKPYEITPEIRALVSEEQWAKILDPKNPEVWRLGMQAWKLDRMIAKDQLLADELGNRIIAVNEAAAEAPVVSEVVTPAPTALSKAPDLLKDPAFIDRELHRADLFGKRDHLIAGMLKEEAEVSGSFADISNKQLRQEVEELIAGKDAAEILNLAEERLARAQRWQNYIDYLNKAKAKIA